MKSHNKNFSQTYNGGLTVGVTRKWAGRGNAILSETTSSRVNCLKTRRVPLVGCTHCWTAGVNGTSFSMRKKLKRGDRAGNASQRKHHFQLYVELQTSGQRQLRGKTEATYTAFNVLTSEPRKLGWSFLTKPTWTANTTTDKSALPIRT